MAKQVVAGAMMQCSFGAAPSALIVLPASRVTVEGKPAANIMDHKPTVNIPPFGMCTAPTNPAVIAATTAALGVPTPAPCVPATPAPWAPGSPTVPIGNKPALNNMSKCMCTWAGAISITNPGTMQTEIP